MSRYLTFLLIGWSVSLSFAPLSRAQGEGAIHVILLAKADRSALPNTAVRLEGLTVPASLTAVSAEDGHFGFQRLIPGDYTLVASRQEFLEERVRFTLK